MQGVCRPGARWVRSRAGMRRFAAWKGLALLPVLLFCVAWPSAVGVQAAARRNFTMGLAVTHHHAAGKAAVHARSAGSDPINVPAYVPLGMASSTGATPPNAGSIGLGAGPS